MECLSIWAKHGFVEECGQLCEGVINKSETVYGVHLLRGRLFYKVLSLKDISSVLLTAHGEKAAVFIWGRKWCRVKVTFPCPSAPAPECTSPPAICGSDIKLGFQLFPANVLTVYSPIPWIFLRFLVFIGVLTMIVLSLESGVLGCFLSMTHPLPFSAHVVLVTDKNHY